MGKRISLAILFIILFSAIHAQEISPFGKFTKDSVMIGEEVQFSLSVRYPKEWYVIFPDSTYDFEPFEYYSKEFYPTRADSTHAIDSVVYTLSTFEVDLIQKLQLPVFLLDKNDSTKIISNPDSVVLNELVRAVPDSLTLKENLTYREVDYTFNYPYLAIGMAVLIALIMIGYLVFGEAIRTKIRLYRMRKAYENFSMQFDQGLSNIRKSERNAALIEEVLVIWKRYMEKLENRPFTKYTSKEILMAGFEKDLKTVLNKIDGAIYGAIGDDEMHKNFETLEDFTLERYKAKVKEVSHG